MSAAELVLAATSGRRARAQALLDADPSLAGDPWVALVLGRGWEGSLDVAGGPRDWVPVLYVTHSAFAPAPLLRALLARGASPDAWYENAFGRMSALYGAVGVARSPEMTALLLDAGADPDDGESVYHACEDPSPECLRLLLARGARVDGTNALAHALDEERPEHLRLLLDAGASVNGPVVAHAVRRGRSVAVVRMLLDAGASPTQPGGETWRGDVPLRTPYEHAVLRGREDLLAVLPPTPVSAADRAVGSLDGPLPAPLDVDQQEVVILAALGGRLDAVVEAVGVGFRGVVGGSPEGTLLHHAAWVGDPALVKALRARGADPRAVCDGGTPRDWALRAADLFSELEGRDYGTVVALLSA